jgi:hypothetical protein
MSVGVSLEPEVQAAALLSSAWSVKPQVVNGARIKAVIDVRSTEFRLRLATLLLAQNEFSLPKQLQN